MYLAHEGNAEGIRKPLDAGTDPNFRDSDARTVLHISARAEAVIEDQWGSTMNVLLHIELTERMKIMPSHIRLRILSCRREYLLMKDLPPRDEQLISDLKQLCMHARCSSRDRRHQRWSRRQVTAGAPDTKMPRISDFLTEDSTWTRDAIATTT